MFASKKLFDIELSIPGPWQIIRNKDGLLVAHDKVTAFDMFEDHSNTLNVSAYTINWIHGGFEEYMDFLKPYLPQVSACWSEGEFVTESLLNTGSRLVLTQTRLFSSKTRDDGCFDIVKPQTVSDSDHSGVSVSLVHGRGFHRKFHITKRSNEEIGLLFMITRDAFIDSYDSNLLALKKYGSYKIYGDVDLEAAAYDEGAKLHILELNLRSEFVGEFDLPFHLRYQKPIKGGAYQEIRLPHPLVVQKDSFFELPSDLFYNFRFSVLQEYDEWSLSTPIGDTNDLHWMPAATILVLCLSIILVVTAIPGLKSKKTQKKTQ